MPFGSESRFFKVLATSAWLFMQGGCGSEEEERESLRSESSGLLEKAMEGKQTLEDGSTYEGELSKGKPNGYGKKTFSSGDVFEGLFKNGLAHGYGTRLYQSDDEIDRYSGLWQAGKKRVLEL